MNILSPLDRAAFSELTDLCRIAAEQTPGPFKPNGTFIQEVRNGGTDRYWYYRGYENGIDGSPGRPTKTYVGRVGDAAIDAVASEHERCKSDYLDRRRLVSRLKRAGLPSPDRIEGAIIGALSEAGLFGSGATIVGSAAFQTYGGLLGIRPRRREFETKDIDIARARGLVIAQGPGASVDVLAALKEVDSSFEPYFLAGEPHLALGFKTSEGFRVEFLTPQAAQRGGATALSKMPEAPGVGAQQLKFLEFSLVETTTSVVLHDAGLLVPVPDPARFAVHKLIVSALRGEGDAGQRLKALKDILQAQALIEGFAHVRDTVRLGDVWLDAWRRGPRWRKALRAGSLRLSDPHVTILVGAVEEAAAIAGRASPFERDETPRLAVSRAGLQLSRNRRT